MVEIIELGTGGKGIHLEIKSVQIIREQRQQIDCIHLLGKNLYLIWNGIGLCLTTRQWRSSKD